MLVGSGCADSGEERVGYERVPHEEAIVPGEINDAKFNKSSTNMKQTFILEVSLFPYTHEYSLQPRLETGK